MCPAERHEVLVQRWLQVLEARHLADLRFAEVTRALRALSAAYVERRETLAARAFSGAGKRAAYALYYAPLHLLTVRAIVHAIGAADARVTHLLDLGCGTGAAGAAWAVAMPRAPRVMGIDAHPWAIGEAMLTYRTFDLDASVRRADLARLTMSRGIDAIVAGWTVNELEAGVRDAWLPRLLECAAAGRPVLVIEPIATRASPWWPIWADAFAGAGGRADTWRFRRPLPDLVKRLDRAAGLRHDEMTARSLYLGIPTGAEAAQTGRR